jgi:hypothetical protein
MELFRGGTFIIEGSGTAWQLSESYRDSAIIRSTRPLPRTYTIRVVVGAIDYELEHVRRLPRDPAYAEGPETQNGCYLLTITDTAPTEHYMNDWWHRHRKVVIDVDNNVWGSGMPHPIFMVYFDDQNKLVSWDGRKVGWEQAWRKGVEYRPDAWYVVDIQRTDTKYTLSVSDEAGTLLARGSVLLGDVWHATDGSPDYFALGDPHENYYQGSMKVRSISLSAP